MKKAIITVVTGGYDDIPPAPQFDGWDAILFTDKEVDDSKGWSLYMLYKQKRDTDALLSRFPKIQSHKLLPEYDLICYQDANLTIIAPPPEQNTFIKHPKRKCLYEEAEKVIRIGRDTKENVLPQIQAYRKKRMPRNYGLYQMGFFVREHSPQMNAIFDQWWDEVSTKSHRDQLSFTYVLWRNRIKIKPTLNRHWSKARPHIAPRQIIQVHHITGGRADKNIGKSLNDLIRNLPDQDWICVRDVDSLPMDHLNLYRQCEEIAHEGEYELVGCMTNRLGLKGQLYGGEVSSNMNILDHMIIGRALSIQHGSRVTPSKANIAGLFMLFPKSAWAKVGGFKEGGIRIGRHLFDYHFSNAIKKSGGRIGIAQGIYLFHLYRIWKEDIKDTEHLK